MSPEFSIGGIADPVAWIDLLPCQAAEYLDKLSTHVAWVDEESARFLDDKRFFKVYDKRVHPIQFRNGQLQHDDLTFYGWVPESVGLLVQSLGVSLRLRLDAEWKKKPDDVCPSAVSAALYDFHLRYELLKGIPKENIAKERPAVHQTIPHAMVCWIARTSRNIGHNDAHRAKWMALYGHEHVKMYQDLAMFPDYLCVMRMAQPNLFGPFYGNFSTSGVGNLQLRRVVLEDTCEEGIIFWPPSKYDIEMRPHWYEAAALSNSVKWTWRPGSIPAPRSAAEQAEQYLWPDPVNYIPKSMEANTMKADPGPAESASLELSEATNNFTGPEIALHDSAIEADNKPPSELSDYDSDIANTNPPVRHISKTVPIGPRRRGRPRRDPLAQFTLSQLRLEYCKLQGEHNKLHELNRHRSAELNTLRREAKEQKGIILKLAEAMHKQNLLDVPYSSERHDALLAEVLSLREGIKANAEEQLKGAVERADSLFEENLRFKAQISALEQLVSTVIDLNILQKHQPPYFGHGYQGQSIQSADERTRESSAGLSDTAVETDYTE